MCKIGIKTRHNKKHFPNKWIKLINWYKFKNKKDTERRKK